MNRFINSPIFITLLVLLTLLSYHSYNKNVAASEIRSVYNELLSISEDAKNDLEKKKIIENFVKESLKQFNDAFPKKGKDDFEIKQENENQLYFSTKQNIELTQPKIIDNLANSNVKRKYIYKVKNNSDQYLSSVNHTISFYKNNEFVEIEEDWGRMKLAPGEEKLFSKPLFDKGPWFDTIKTTVNDITILKMPRK